jgi:hypothetical protein
VLVCNAGHVKNVPDRKTDLADAEWLAQLLECGLLAGSFIPRRRPSAVAPMQHRGDRTGPGLSGLRLDRPPAQSQCQGRRIQTRH